MRLGFAPITWNNEDIGSELGAAGVPFLTVLDEIVAAGYEGTELGDGFPRSPSELKAGLDSRGLVLTSAWCGLDLTAESQPRDLEHTRELCGLLSQVGASYVNLAHQSTPERGAYAGRASEAPPVDDWDGLADTVCKAAKIAQEHGLQALFHAHAGTFVETSAELDELLARAPAPLLKLVWDVGHAIYGRIDPVAVVRKHPERIAYLHLKDVDGAVLEQLRAERLGFVDGIRRRVFTELGDGLLDVPDLLQALGEIGYDGWLMVEQDSTWRTPIESARRSRAYLRSLGL